MLKYFKKYWYFAVLAPLFMAVEAGMDLLQPRLMGKIVDEGVLGLSNGNVRDQRLQRNESTKFSYVNLQSVMENMTQVSQMIRCFRKER